MNAIKTEKLTKTYGKSRGITELDLTVDEGDFFGFIGPNGAGKSTTIRTLLGLITQTSGKAEIFGLDTVSDKQEILKQIGYLPSEASLYRTMKVKDMLRFSASLRNADCEKEAAALCERLSLDTEKKISELSFGNRKKTAIVCALQHMPRLLLLDEPTSGLDPLIQREFYSILKERNLNGTTVFLSSHVLSEIERYCRRAAVIREGRLVACDSVEKLGHTGVKRVTLRKPLTVPDFHGIRDLKSENENVTFLYSGTADALIRELSLLSFEDITLEDPDLEDVFMHYYAKEEN